MKYHIVSGDSTAGSLKYYFKENNINDIIINHFDDLSVGPLQVNFEERVNWIKDRLFPWDNKEDAEEISEYIKEVYNTFLSFLSKVNEEDEIYIWYGENVMENLMLYRVCHDVKKGKIYGIYVSDYKTEHGYFPKSVGECSPEDLGRLISTGLELSGKDISVFSNYYTDTLNTKSYLRILKEGKIQAVDETYYDENFLKHIPTNMFIPAGRPVGDMMGKSEQRVGDSFLQYRLSHLIGQGKVLTEGKLSSLREFNVKRGVT